MAPAVSVGLTGPPVLVVATSGHGACCHHATMHGMDHGGSNHFRGVCLTCGGLGVLAASVVASCV